MRIARTMGVCLVSAFAMSAITAGSASAACGDPIPGADVSLEQIPGGIVATTGTVITEVQANKMLSKVAVKYGETEGKQTFTHCEGGPTTTLESSWFEGPLEEAVLTLTASQTNEEKLEINSTVNYGNAPEYGRCLKVTPGFGKYHDAACTLEFGNQSYEWYPAFGGKSPLGKTKFTTAIKPKTVVTLETVGTPTPPVSPEVTGLAPKEGPPSGGTLVTIVGSQLSGATAVKFGSTKATGVVVNSDNVITATAPAGTGVVNVTVTTPGGTSAVNAGDQFSYGQPHKMTCTGETSKGEYTGAQTVGHMVITFTGCTSNGAPDQSEGAKEGEVRSQAIACELGVIKGSEGGFEDQIGNDCGPEGP
jgi:hypothetical protein